MKHFTADLHGEYRPFTEVEIHEILSQRPGHDNVEGHQL